MKALHTYKKLGLIERREVFHYLINNMKESNRTFDFFVDWAKVFSQVENIEVELNLLNYLVGKESIENELFSLIKRYPDIVSVIPALIALRDKSARVLVDYRRYEWLFKNYTFRLKNTYTDNEIASFVEFCSEVGLLELFKNRKIKNVVDYYIGLEVGIGTNGRKNRGGKLMEDIVEWYISTFTNPFNLPYIRQASAAKIRRQWNIELPLDKSSRQYDYAILKNNKLVLIEANFFSGGGSKLKSIAGEFISLDNFLSDIKLIDSFIWVTDGMGWNTAKAPLRETFINNDYVLNTRMIADGALEEILLG